jgi:chromosome segregation ATPase
MTITIDAIYFMLIAEAAIIFFILTISFALKSRKYRRLYQKTLNEVSETAAVVVPEKIEEPAAPPVAPEPEAQAIPEPQLEVIEEKLVEQEANEEETVVPETPEEEDTGSAEGKIKKLNKIISFQKDKILELMSYKDIFEGAQKKLGKIQENSEELHDRLIKLLGTSAENPGLSDALEGFKGNNNELKVYVEILEKENDTLNDKFARWEVELKEIWEQAETEGTVDEGRYEEIMKEKDELLSKIWEFETMVDEKNKIVEDMKKQYEDLEAEYMTLYRQSQGKE